jgi:N-acetyl-gamma-glutamylphosphate reductase
MIAKTLAIILGGSGYVAGELLRLLLHHPGLEPTAVVSTSQAGEHVTQAFPQLRGTQADALRFATVDSLPGLLDRKSVV